MTEHLAITLAAASVGFVSAVFFCIGNAVNTPSKILLQSTPFWDFSEPVARALSAQRAQYTVGGLLLLLAFLLQLAADLASSSLPAAIPQWLQAWPYLLLAILFSTGLIGGGLSALIYKTTVKEVLRLQIEKKEENEAKLENDAELEKRSGA